MVSAEGQDEGRGTVRDAVKNAVGGLGFDPEGLAVLAWCGEDVFIVVDPAVGMEDVETLGPGDEDAFQKCSKAVALDRVDTVLRRAWGGFAIPPFGAMAFGAHARDVGITGPGDSQPPVETLESPSETLRWFANRTLCRFLVDTKAHSSLIHVFDIRSGESFLTVGAAAHRDSAAVLHVDNCINHGVALARAEASIEARWGKLAAAAGVAVDEFRATCRAAVGPLSPGGG